MSTPIIPASIPLDAVLCYIDPKSHLAYFTTRPLEEAIGDDWNDTPYEHNAGRPYDARVYHKVTGSEKCPEQHHPDGTPKFMNYEIGWSGPYQEPCADHCNSPWCVDDINARSIPWLSKSMWHSDYKGNGSHIEPIWAGDTLAEFIRKMHKAGGQVLFPLMPLGEADAINTTLVRIVDRLEKSNAHGKINIVRQPEPTAGRRYLVQHGRERDEDNIWLDSYASITEAEEALNKLMNTVNTRMFTPVDLLTGNEMAVDKVYRLRPTESKYV